MKRFIAISAVWAVLLSASTALAQADDAKPQESAAKLAALRAERSKLDREVRRGLFREYSKLRSELSSHEDLAPLKKQLKQAEEAYKLKVKDDEKIKAAAKEEQAAQEAVREATAKAVAGDTTLARFRQDLLHAERSLFDSGSIRRVAGFQLTEVRRRITTWDDSVLQKRKESAKIARAYRDLMRDNKALYNAAFAVERAERNYRSRLRYGRGRRTPKEGEGKELPEYRAWQEAKQAYDVLLKTDENRAIIKAQAEAHKAEQEVADKAFETDEEAVALRKKIEQAKATEKIDQEEIRSIRNKILQAEQDIQKKDPAVAEARKAWEEAYRAQRKVGEQQASEEADAVKKARMELYKKTGELFAADERGAALKKQMEKVNEQIGELDKQIYAITGLGRDRPTTRRPRTSPRATPRNRGQRPKPAAPAVVKPKPQPEPAVKPKPEPEPESLTKQQQVDKQCKQWLNLAENYIQARNAAKARQYLQLIILSHPGTAWSAMAQTRLAEIDAKAKDSK